MGLFASILGGVFGGSNDKGCDWYCDGCSDYMNNQSGFTTSSNRWVCTACGYANDVSEDNIRYDIENDDSIGESLSVDDAALMWASSGKDEDYMFGYTEAELKDAL